MAGGRLAALLIALSVAGCGGPATPAKPVAQRVCGGAGRAAARAGRVTVRILAHDATNVVCALDAGRARVRVVSQATPQAYTEFNTEDSHQSQVYGPGVNQPDRTPVPATVHGASVAVWVPGQGELIATNASPTRQGGAYVTVTVSRLPRAGARPLAVAIGEAVFAAHPAS
ncbi:MAG TPA: hypothetical protein VFN55_09695 [Solirubrobacteraceae bacterium]|nr:hypothetical protein [Solirubrobacteraceae bacterium]